MVDEALGFTVVVETTRDALPTIRKHLDSLGVPLLTPGSGGLVEKGDAFIPPLNQMLIGEGRVAVALLGTEILSVEGVELGGEYETKDLRDRTLPRVWLTDDEEQTLVFDFSQNTKVNILQNVQIHNDGEMITGKNTMFNAVCNDPSVCNMDNITAYTTYIYMVYVSSMSPCPAVLTI